MTDESPSDIKSTVSSSAIEPTVISSSASVVVQRIEGSPVWKLTATDDDGVNVIEQPTDNISRQVDVKRDYLEVQDASSLLLSSDDLNKQLEEEELMSEQAKRFLGDQDNSLLGPEASSSNLHNLKLPEGMLGAPADDLTEGVFSQELAVLDPSPMAKPTRKSSRMASANASVAVSLITNPDWAASPRRSNRQAKPKASFSPPRWSDASKVKLPLQQSPGSSRAPDTRSRQLSAKQSADKSFREKPPIASRRLSPRNAKEKLPPVVATKSGGPQAASTKKKSPSLIKKKTATKVSGSKKSPNKIDDEVSSSDEETLQQIKEKIDKRKTLDKSSGGTGKNKTTAKVDIKKKTAPKRNAPAVAEMATKKKREIKSSSSKNTVSPSDDEPLLFTPDVINKAQKKSSGETKVGGKKGKEGGEVKEQNKKADTTMKGLDRRTSEENQKKQNSDDDIGDKDDSSGEEFEPINLQQKDLYDDEADMSSLLSSDENDYDDGDSDWTSEDDPEKLWCVCKQPHNNRFMICCDKCEEWYHGSCVGVTKTEGKEMEKESKEYICPFCKENIKEGQEKDDVKESSKSKDVKNSETTKSPVKKKMIKIFKRPMVPKQHCILGGCQNWAQSGSVYCSQSCIFKHAQESLKMLDKEKDKLGGGSGTKFVLKKNLTTSAVELKPTSRKDNSNSTTNKKERKEGGAAADRVAVFERHSGKILAGMAAPKQQNLEDWLARHPSFEVLRPGQRFGYTPTNFYQSDKKKAKVKESKEQTVHHKEKPDDIDSSIRANVKRSLKELFIRRSKNTGDLNFQEDNCSKCAKEIELELFNLYQDTGARYKSKYRTLMFNLKDEKNQGLFRKVLKGSLKPKRLVRMSSEELASRELSKWRQMETKHNLEMIKKTEEETYKTQITKKTHKGEVEIEDDGLKVFEQTGEKEKVSKDVASSPGGGGSGGGDAGVVVNMSGSQGSEGGVSGSSNGGLFVDTTSEHKNHLFDLNCKICTGKLLPSQKKESSLTKKPKVVYGETAIDEIKPASSKLLLTNEKNLERYSTFDLTPVPKIVEKYSTLDSTPVPQIVATNKKESTSDKYKIADTSIMSKSREASYTPPYQPPPATDVAEDQQQPFSSASGSSLWRGSIFMDSVAKATVQSYPVSGPMDHINASMPVTLELCGRIPHETVWKYLEQLRSSSTREISVIRFEADRTEEDNYEILFSYFHTRSRCGVVGNKKKHIKDMYILPLASDMEVPKALMPFNGPGLTVSRPNTLLGILVQQKQHRHSYHGEPGAGAGAGTAKKAPHQAVASATVKRHFSDDSTAGPGSYREEQGPKRKRHQDKAALAEYVSDDPIVNQYAHADSSVIEDPDLNRPYSPTQEEEEAPYDPTDAIEDEIDDVATKPTTAAPIDNSKSSPSFIEQQEMLMKLTEQVEQTKKELLEQQMESFKSEITKLTGLKIVAGGSQEVEPAAASAAIGGGDGGTPAISTSTKASAPASAPAATGATGAIVPAPQLQASNLNVALPAGATGVPALAGSLVQGSLSSISAPPLPQQQQVRPILSGDTLEMGHQPYPPAPLNREYGGYQADRQWQPNLPPPFPPTNFDDLNMEVFEYDKQGQLQRGRGGRDNVGGGYGGYRDHRWGPPRGRGGYGGGYGGGYENRGRGRYQNR